MIGVFAEHAAREAAYCAAMRGHARYYGALESDFEIASKGFSKSLRARIGGVA